MPENYIAAAVRQSLASSGAGDARHERFGCPFHFYETMDSTMTEAARLAEAGAPTGTLVMAEEQTAGRGRLGRQWVSESGAGLYFTLILRPTLAPAATPMLTLMAGVSLAEAVRPFVSDRVDLRWPNDLLISEKKCAGILVEMRADPERAQSERRWHVLLGIGINVNNTEFPEGLETEPTSLLLEAGQPIPRVDLLISVLKRLEEDYNSLLVDGAQPILKRFSTISSYASGKRVRAGEDGHFITGTTEGLTPEGVLLLRRDDGGLEKIIAGHVRPL
ncbi:MAG: biotin--[acetyl-CoA-carboxylase] ligase [Acidobacteria bacterium]|nr:biotin--[acetyl-CoA-carboxylase] ligase [Acidobacteriota bacterium]